jgi:hypothetical protein
MAINFPERSIKQACSVGTAQDAVQKFTNCIPLKGIPINYMDNWNSISTKSPKRLLQRGLIMFCGINQMEQKLFGKYSLFEEFSIKMKKKRVDLELFLYFIVIITFIGMSFRYPMGFAGIVGSIIFIFLRRRNKKSNEESVSDLKDYFSCENIEDEEFSGFWKVFPKTSRKFKGLFKDCFFADVVLPAPRHIESCKRHLSSICDAMKIYFEDTGLDAFTKRNSSSSFIGVGGAGIFTTGLVLSGASSILTAAKNAVDRKNHELLSLLFSYYQICDYFNEHYANTGEQ